MQRSALPGEAPIKDWGEFTLTTHRVWVVKTKNGTDALQSMPIDTVQSVGIERQHFPVLLLLAILSMLGAVVVDLSGSNNSRASFAVGILAVVFLGSYIATRKVMVAIHAGSVVMTMAVDGAKAKVDAALRFLDAVESQGLAVRRASDPNMGRTSATFATSQSR